MLTILMLLAISEPAIDTNPVLPTVGADLIPGPPALPADLPAKISVDEPVKGTLLPYPRDVAVGKLVRYCVDEYPRVCGSAITNTREVEQAVCRGQLAVQRMQCRAADVREDLAESRGWPTWEVVAIAVGVGILAGAAGVGVGVLSR